MEWYLAIGILLAVFVKAMQPDTGIGGILWAVFFWPIGLLAFLLLPKGR